MRARESSELHAGLPIRSGGGVTHYLVLYNNANLKVVLVTLRVCPRSRGRMSSAVKHV